MKRLSVFCFTMLLCLGILAGCASEESSVLPDTGSSEPGQSVSGPQQSAEESEGTSEEAPDESEETPAESEGTAVGTPTVYMTMVRYQSPLPFPRAG